MLTAGQTYKRTVFISTIITAALIASLFLFLPKKSVPHKKILYNGPSTISQEIPHPVKSLRLQKVKPDTTRTFIRDKMQSYKLPEDVRKSLTAADHNPDLNSKETSPEHKNFAGVAVEKGNSGSANPARQNSIPEQSIPRLIYEEVPRGGENKFNGNLQLSLKINADGQVVEHRVLSNSLDCTDCLNAIIQAAYKSKWAPAVIDGKKREYWVVKTYSFK